MFADDTTLSAVVPDVKSREAIAESINTDLREIEAWADKWLAKFNAKKTRYFILVENVPSMLLILAFVLKPSSRLIPSSWLE